MNVELLSAVRDGTDFATMLPCGVVVSIPGHVLQDWSKTRAPDEFRAKAGTIMAASGESLAANQATPILEVILQLLPSLLPICLPLITNSITKPTTPTTPVNGPVVPI